MTPQKINVLGSSFFYAHSIYYLFVAPISLGAMVKKGWFMNHDIELGRTMPNQSGLVLWLTIGLTLHLQSYRGFDEIYDVEKFITSMSGVVHVETRKHPELKLVSVRVPYNANRNYILTNIQPLFYTTQYLRVITYFPSSTTSQGKVDKDMNPHSCWATFEALHLNPELQEVLDSIVGKIKGHGLNGQFIAIDYKGEIVGTSACRNDGMNRIKSCYNPMEIAQFLRRVGYQKDTTIYVTDQSRSDNGLNVLKDFYPNTFTKDDIMQETEKGKSELELKLIDFKLCSISDVFVPAKSGLFYANVVANRIASRKTEVFVPAQVTSTLARDHISSYISKRSHPAYACFCP
ncbi:GDP-fucose protein O-fucosyltransferase [Cynara cardunculus var. scolymus]|uniref:O-fucosyltransferase family protein n=1 Tax=Cynara cardunculus var. scolymus TaxID=59895 RepID=A0A103XBX8_CYNCS|nr:GDP-fucose protein O-fucosyltransferase [Cynara cardunculus var. scolymus]